MQNTSAKPLAGDHLPPQRDTGYPALSEACGCDVTDQKSGLISIDEALSLISDRTTALSGVDLLPLQAAIGRVLLDPVPALSDMPRFDNAAMDGYAFCSAALAGDGPWRLPVVARVAAGEHLDRALPQGSAARILTGAPVPFGADCVAMQESVTRDGDHILLTKKPAVGQHIRLQGEEYRTGDDILAAGTQLNPRAVAACASAGHTLLPVRRKLRVTLLVSGTEVAPSGVGHLDRAQIWDVNTPMLHARLTRPEIELVDVGHIDDSLFAARQALSQAAAEADLVITTGGISVGEEDHLRTAVNSLNGVTHFAGVAIKPGKPVAFGRVGAAVWLGLPGNPQSAFTTWTLFGEALLKQLTGRVTPHISRRHVVLGHPMSRKPGKCEVRPAKLMGCDGTGRERIECRDGIHSGQVTVLAQTDGLVFLPADADQLPEGALVEFLPFPDN